MRRRRRQTHENTRLGDRRGGGGDRHRPSPWANRGPVTISVAPFPYTLEIPMWALAVGALLVGFLTGALVRWLLDHKVRSMARRGRRRTRALEQELGAGA